MVLIWPAMLINVPFTMDVPMSSVMVVDDSRSQRLVIQQYLDPLKCQVVLCASGPEALSAIEDTAPDVIILDVEMAGLSGFETCRALRGYLHNDWVPIIYLTGRSSPDDMVEGLEAGGDAYITKPVNEAVLRAMVKAMLRISSIQQELIEANKKLDEIAHFDVLTQVMNRRGYEDIYDRLWHDHKRRKQSLCVLLLDIDHFKTYNDHYGHIAGDQCLRQVATTIKSTLKRPIDVIARYGGEEFVIILPDTDLDGAQTVAQRIVDAMNQAAIPHEKSSCADHVTVSIGVAQSPDFAKHDIQPSELVQQADEALYQSKEAGRNRATCAKFNPQ